MYEIIFKRQKISDRVLFYNMSEADSSYCYAGIPKLRLGYIVFKFKRKAN